MLRPKGLRLHGGPYPQDTANPSRRHAPYCMNNSYDTVQRHREGPGPTHRTNTQDTNLHSVAHSTAQPGTAANTRPKTGRGNQRAQAPSTGPGRTRTITLSHVQCARDQARAHRRGRLGRHHSGRKLPHSQKTGEAVAVTRETRAGRGCAERGRG